MTCWPVPTDDEAPLPEPLAPPARRKRDQRNYGHAHRVRDPFPRTPTGNSASRGQIGNNARGPRPEAPPNPMTDLTTYQPILIYVGLLVGFVITNLVLAHALGPRRRTPVKDMPYESGMDPVGDARQPFDIKFYVVAILFLVFDVELLFLYPWAVSAYVEEGGVPDGLRSTVFGVMLVFMATLGIAYVYAWRKGVFKWR